MADVFENTIQLYYCDDDGALLRAVSALVKVGSWFDVRRPATHRWSITCPDGKLPATVKKGLILPPKTAQRGDAMEGKSLASYKAAKKKEMKGKRR